MTRGAHPGRRWRLAAGLLLAAGAAAVLVPHLFARVREVVRIGGAIAGPRRTVQERVRQHGPAARARLAPHFAAAGVPYPPQRVTLVGLKAERRLELWAAGDGGPLRHVWDYPVLGASGGPGPKLREGDRQVPEGLYAVESLNPNSRFHLSLRLNYPNAFDREHGAADGRARLGGDIMIHGRTASIGCLAMGDPAIEELFTLAADTGVERLEVILAPCDLRTRPVPAADSANPPPPPWYPQLCDRIRDALAACAGPRRPWPPR